MFRFYLEMTVKNLLRNKRRTILTTVAIAVGIFYYIFFDSMMTGMDRDAIQSMLDLEVGHFQVLPAKTDQKKQLSLKYLVPEGVNNALKIRELPEISGATPRLLFPLSITNGLDELPVTGIGVDPKYDPTVFQIKKYVKGQWVRPGEASIILGKRVADLLEIKLGEQITIRTQTKRNIYQALDLTVVGLIYSPDPVVNENQIFLPLDTAQNALGTDQSVTMIAVKAKSFANRQLAIAQVQQLSFQGFRSRIKPWEEAAAAFLADMELHRVFSFILMFLVAIISIIGVVNSILLASLERVREIGILKAMGMTEREITHLFTFEALGIGFIGGLFGTSLGIIANFYLVNVGIDFQKMYGNINFNFSINTIYGVWNWPVMIWTFLFGLAIALIASFIPAHKAAKIDPAISLRRT